MEIYGHKNIIIYLGLGVEFGYVLIWNLHFTSVENINWDEGKKSYQFTFIQISNYNFT